MIHFSLRCEAGGHGFDGWFRSNADFDRQAAAGLVTCPACGTVKVHKALMAPTVRSVAEEAAAPVPAAPKQAAAAGLPPEKLAAVHAKLQEIAREVRASSDYVGPRFAEEARRIHFGETQERRIYGEASGEEIRALAEDGIAALPLPALPEDKH